MFSNYVCGLYVPAFIYHFQRRRNIMFGLNAEARKNVS